MPSDIPMPTDAPEPTDTPVPSNAPVPSDAPEPTDLVAANVISSRATETDAAALEHEIDDFSIDSPAEPLEPAAPVRQRPTVEERFGRAIMRLRLYQGWSQRDLQRTCGVHQSQISRLESGKQRGLSSRRIFAILRALHVGEIAFLPPPTVPQTQLEIMLFGDPWERAGRAVERRVNRRRSGGR